MVWAGAGRVPRGVLPNRSCAIHIHDITARWSGMAQQTVHCTDIAVFMALSINIMVCLPPSSGKLRREKYFNIGKGASQKHTAPSTAGEGHCTAPGEGHCTAAGEGHCTAVGEGHCTSAEEGHCTTVGEGHCTSAGEGHCTGTPPIHCFPLQFILLPFYTETEFSPEKLINSPTDYTASNTRKQ